MNETAVSRRTEIILISLLLIAAAVLRMGWPGLTEFKADEARLLALALDMAEGQFALRGISSSVGFPNFPASVWIYSIPLFVWPHPYAATIFTGLLNTAAIAASYWFVRRYWGISAALAATLMLTVSPWAIIFSRKIWAQNLLPLFIVGWAIGAALAFVERRQKYIWLHFVCLALSVQIHLAAIALVPVTVILLIIFGVALYLQTRVSRRTGAPVAFRRSYPGVGSRTVSQRFLLAGGRFQGNRGGAAADASESLPGFISDGFILRVVIEPFIVFDRLIFAIELLIGKTTIVSGLVLVFSQFFRGVKLVDNAGIVAFFEEFDGAFQNF